MTFHSWLPNLSQADYGRLMLYAKNRFGWLMEKRGLSPEELVNEAILRHWDGRRKSPPTGETQTYLKWVCQTIKSIVSHEWEARQHQPPVETAEEAIVANTADPKAVPLEAEIVGDDLLAAFRETLTNESYRQVCDGLMQGDTVSVIAKRLGVTVARVSQIKRHLADLFIAALRQ